ncbi:hypothetical protein [uncultured Thalassospira sp.]|uniref:hypothetical protein n=1 Tax=uncultured Thalassospira sp. TaxID=404382 RepID=UPI0030DAFE02
MSQEPERCAFSKHPAYHGCNDVKNENDKRHFSPYGPGILPQYSDTTFFDHIVIVV